MTYTRTKKYYTSRQVWRDRQAGRFICRCRRPQPVLLPEWRTFQCGHCGRKIIEMEVAS